MFGLPLHKHAVSLPDGATPPISPATDLENVSHTPGQVAAIRFFDPHSHEDFYAMKEILAEKAVRQWMDDAVHLSKEDYRDWAGTASKESFLFAILDAEAPSLELMTHVQGFIYIYSEREEKFRVKRMEKQGYLQPAKGTRYCLEVSFARRPARKDYQPRPGLISSALRQSCLQVKLLLSNDPQPEVEIFGFVDIENFPAQRTLESAGFVRKGQMKYDWDSEDSTYLYILDWPTLEQKMQQRLLEVLQANQPDSRVV